MITAGITIGNTSGRFRFLDFLFDRPFHVILASQISLISLISPFYKERGMEGRRERSFEMFQRSLKISVPFRLRNRLFNF